MLCLVLVLALSVCASLKSEEDFSLISDSSLITNFPNTIKKFDHKIFNVKGVSHEASNREYLEPMADFYPGLQAKLRKTCRSAKNYCDNFPLYQMKLARQLDIEGFERMPLHSM